MYGRCELGFRVMDAGGKGNLTDYGLDISDYGIGGNKGFVSVDNALSWFATHHANGDPKTTMAQY
jgi:hypothetical protein